MDHPFHVLGSPRDACMEMLQDDAIDVKTSKALLHHQPYILEFDLLICLDLDSKFTSAPCFSYACSAAGTTELSPKFTILDQSIFPVFAAA
jgi:hypothetical protein